MTDSAGYVQFYAHSHPERPHHEWHRLEDHLQAVSELAAAFADAFDSADWGRVAGLWHDLGKYQPEFQARLLGATEAVDHSTVGALLADAKDSEGGKALAFAIAGHHGGLPNAVQRGDTDRSSLLDRLRRSAPLLDKVLAAAAPTVTDHTVPVLPSWLEPGCPGDRAAQQRLIRRTELWVRFLFSALVDADFLDTEEFFEPGKRAAVGRLDTVATLRERLDAHLDRLSAEAEPTKVNGVRRDVLQACRSAARVDPGLFSLSVPTGGGKTLSAMAFALRHAHHHGLRRVIVVIPYTSIIEQNAAVYRDVLGEANVIEHHSNLDPVQETPRNKLASENWDAPVVVTTSVQFFESLFANRPSRCRKLHNVAKSVVVLDEVQTLPSAFLLSILDALNELARGYGCSVVLSTATQPALAKRDTLPEGLTDVREIVPAPRALADRLKRVTVHWPDPDDEPRTWPELAEELRGHPRVLAIVHRRQDARDLAQLLPPEGLFHLSALMCPRHRSDTLAQVREALAGDGPCRLVSTQLIEAGVDVDFPVVYRALGGLDRIVQGAGRCNREGKGDAGRVVVFRAPTPPPRGAPTKGLETTLSLLREREGGLDVDDPVSVE